METCRTCKHTDPGCLMRIRGRRGLDCYYYEPRETPLLVDELAKILRRLSRSVNFDESYTAPEYAYPDAEEEIEAALARYKEEVGDAHD